MDILIDAICQLRDLRPELLTGAWVVAMCYGLKFMPIFPNKWIPTVCMLAPAILYPFIAGPGEVRFDVWYPQIRLSFEGFIIGVVSWAAHHQILRKYLDPILEKDNQSKADDGKGI